MSGVIRQQNRTTEELRDEGFKQFPRKKEIIMARPLPEAEAPLNIDTSWGGILVALAGDMICYRPGTEAHEDHTDYDHWSVKPEIFEKTYKAWDEPFNPTPAQQHLMDATGCKPYYKHVGVWAKSLDHAIYLQGLEHEKPVLIPEDRVLAIGEEGEPWVMGRQTFHDRYDGALQKPASSSNPFKRITERLIKFFTGD